MINLENYLKDADKCPRCGGEHIDPKGEPTWNGEHGEGEQSMICYACGLTWKDIIKVVGIVGMPRPRVIFDYRPIYSTFVPDWANLTERNEETNRIYLNWTGRELRSTIITDPQPPVETPPSDEPY